MPDLASLVATNSTPIVTQISTNYPVVEPLDGPTAVDDLMDRFPEEIYQQGRDTHLYRFITALCGDAGAGLLKKQALSARLKYEAEFLNFRVLDEIYAAQFRFRRLAQEIYDIDPETQTVTPNDLDVMALADQSYHQRAQEFFTAIRSGNSPTGLITMAQAGSGLEADMIEHYKYIFDQYSDMPLDLEAFGTSLSTSEYIILSRLLNAGSDFEYTRPWTWEYVFTPPSITTGSGRPAPIVSPLSLSKDYVNTESIELDPEIERNVLDLLDRLEPTSTYGTLKPQEVKYTVNGINQAFASSERLYVNRVITGKTDVRWPPIDAVQGFFIQAGVETEATTMFATARELPIVFQTIDNAIGYTEQALADPLYGLNDFYIYTGGIAPISTYLSEHIGNFTNILVAIFPFLSQVETTIQFNALNAVAAQDTPLRIDGKAIGN